VLGAWGGLGGWHWGAVLVLSGHVEEGWFGV
jgi:hypothetical protein